MVFPYTGALPNDFLDALEFITGIYHWFITGLSLIYHWFITECEMPS